MEKVKGNSYDEKFDNIVSRCNLNPRRCHALRKFYRNGEYPCKVKGVWLFLEAAREQDSTTLAYQCEMMLVKLLNESNYQQYLKESLICGSWELKLVLIAYFGRTGRTIMSNATWPCTVQLLKDVLQAFKEESYLRFGLKLGTIDDPLKLYVTLRKTSRKNIGKKRPA